MAVNLSTLTVNQILGTSVLGHYTNVNDELDFDHDHAADIFSTRYDTIPGIDLREDHP